MQAMHSSFILVIIFAVAPAIQIDQDRSEQVQGDGGAVVVQQTIPNARQGETARSTVGQTGQRQTRDQLAADAGIEPMARINSRVQNRVQSRIRNRIDRYYDPQANAVSPFVVAGDQARTAGRPRR